jgi:Inorganic Pyrophosphatase
MLAPQPNNIVPGRYAPMTPYGGNNSMYEDARAFGGPPPEISDVDLNANWYSPMQPIWPYGPPYLSFPRTFDYPIGYNLNYIQPRMDLMQMLRAMRSSWGVLATVIATRQDQLLRIPWTIQKKGHPRASSAGVNEMIKFFRRPDGQLTYSQWSRKLTDDLLVLDAPTIYFWRDKKGRPIGAEVMDGATIFPLIDDAGRRPNSIVEVSEDGLTYLKRQPAFQQIIKGLPLVDLDESELMYVPMRPRPEFPVFGYPATEQILVEATEAIRKTFYQLEYWKDGTIPDLIVTVPQEWSPRNIATFQAHFDALLSGNTVLKSKVRFLPGGMKPFDVKNSSGESLWSQRDETLIRLCCYSYSVSPAPFIKMLNRSTAQNAQQMAEEEGLYPLMSYWKDDIMDPIIQEQFGYDDIEFVFQPRPEPDQEKAAKIHDLKIKNGEMSRNEARAEDGLEPIPGGDVFTIEIGNAVIPVELAAKGQAMPMGSAGGPQPTPETSPGGKNDVGKPKPPVPKAGANGSIVGGPRPPSPTRGPVSGARRPITDSASPPTTKAILQWILKATRTQVNEAARSSDGDIDRVSHLVQANGNYKKGHVWIQGLDISIENEKGSYRGEKDDKGVKWQVRMPSHYGYIRGTIGADHMQVDCYIGKHPDSDMVWVIDQNKVSPKGKVKNKFDEHKVFIGFRKVKKVEQVYLDSHFDGKGHEMIADIVELSMDDFKDWLKNGDTTAPIADQHYGTIVEDLHKVDTISTASNLSSNTPTSSTPIVGDPFLTGGGASAGSKKTKKKKKKNLTRGPRWKQLGAAP